MTTTTDRLVSHVRRVLEPAHEALIAADAKPDSLALDRAIGALVSAELLLDEAQRFDPDEPPDRAPAEYARELAALDPDCGRCYCEIWRRHEAAQAERCEAWARVQAISAEEVARFYATVEALAPPDWRRGQPTPELDAWLASDEDRGGAAPLRQPRANLTDAGNAERFAHDHRGRLLYVPGIGWHEWDGARWAPDDGRGVATEAAKATARGIRDEARAIEDGDLAKKVFAWATASEHRARLEAMVKLAQSAPGLQTIADRLDADPYLLNVANGTIDQRSGGLRAHESADRITKLAPVTYDPAARDGRWQRFIEELTGGDPDLATFLQRAVGYSLTGDT